MGYNSTLHSSLFDAQLLTLRSPLSFRIPHLLSFWRFAALHALPHGGEAAEAAGKLTFLLGHTLISKTFLAPYYVRSCKNVRDVR